MANNVEITIIPGDVLFFCDIETTQLFKLMIIFSNSKEMRKLFIYLFLDIIYSTYERKTHTMLCTMPHSKQLDIFFQRCPVLLRTL